VKLAAGVLSPCALGYQLLMARILATDAGCASYTRVVFSWKPGIGS